MKRLFTLCTTVGLALLTSNAFSTQLLLCPPASAIQKNTTSGKWTLAPLYENKGWRIVQNSFPSNPSNLTITDKSTLSVRITTGGAYLPNDAHDNFNPVKGSPFFRVTCSYIDSIPNLNDGSQRTVSINIESTHDSVYWSDNKEFKLQYNGKLWENYLKTHNQDFINGSAEGMVCMTTADRPDVCSIPYHD